MQQLALAFSDPRPAPLPDVATLSDRSILQRLLSLEPQQADRLMLRFGSLARVMAAEPELLSEWLGPEKIAQLSLLSEANRRAGRVRQGETTLLSDWDSLIEYCRREMAHREIESFRALFLNSANGLIADEELARGTVNHVPVYPREVIKRALTRNASALILVHNHPSGDPNPSEADISLTEQIRSACALLGITLHDHVIVSDRGHFSFVSAGLI